MWGIQASKYRSSFGRSNQSNDNKLLVLVLDCSDFTWNLYEFCESWDNKAWLPSQVSFLLEKLEVKKTSKLKVKVTSTLGETRQAKLKEATGCTVGYVEMLDPVGLGLTVSTATLSDLIRIILGVHMVTNSRLMPLKSRAFHDSCSMNSCNCTIPGKNQTHV